VPVEPMVGMKPAVMQPVTILIAVSGPLKGCGIAELQDVILQIQLAEQVIPVKSKAMVNQNASKHVNPTVLVRLELNVVLATAWTVIVVIGPVMEPVCTVLQAVVIIITKEKIQKMNVMVRVLVAGLVMATSQEDVNIPALQSPAVAYRIAIT